MRFLAQGLRTAVCAAALLLAAGTAAQATTIYVRDGNNGNAFNGNGVGSVNLRINVGGTNRDVAAGAFALQYRYLPTDSWTSFLTYCLEPDVNLNVGSTQVEGQLQLVSSTAEFAAKATILSNYYNTYYTDSLTTRDKSAAFQLGLWELAYDTGGSLSGGNFKYVSGSNNVRDQANLYLDQSKWLTQSEIGVIVRSSPDNQDLVIVLPPQPAQVIPEPATLALFGLGLAGLGLAMRRRTREVPAPSPQA